MKTSSPVFRAICASLVLLLLLNSCKEDKTPKPFVPAQYSIEQFYKNENIGSGQFSVDETKMLYHSNQSGIYNLYEMDLASGQSRQVTMSDKESFYAIGYANAAGDMLYSADKGGDENDHIFLLKANGETTDLTPKAGAKADFFGFSKDRSAFYYISNMRDAKFFDLYKMDLTSQKSELLYQNKDGLDVAAISDDENMLALSKSITTSENQLFLYDRAKKQMTEISAPDQKGNYGAADFSPDNKQFEYTTDVGKEFTYLVSYNVAAKTKKPIFEAKWDVMYAQNSLNNKFKVIGVNEDGKNSITLLDHATGQKVDFPTIPDGDIIGVNIAWSEKRMRLSVGSSKSPTNLYLYDFESKKLQKLTNALNPEINAQDLVSATVVRYKSFDGLEIPAIYYKPHQASANTKVPAIVWVHGGPGGQSRTGYISLIQYLVNHGYAVLAVNNRGSSGYGKTFYKMDDRNHGDKDLQDCVYGKKWLQSQDGIAADQIGIMGGSYGGYMTMAALTYTPEEFKVGVNIFGVTNWLRTLKSIPPYWESFRTALYTEIGDPTTSDSVRLHAISPLFHAQKVTKPLMVLQGAQDPRVLQAESDEIVAAVKKNGVPVEYVLFPDEGHGFVKKENEIKGYGQILNFLDKYLKDPTVEATKLKQ
jgi:dipeptidyl aminopeptidase/acylaminoacyl peptidase